MVFREEDAWAMEARWQGDTHRIELYDGLHYKGPLFSARLDTKSFEPVQINVSAETGDGSALSLEPAATMYVLLNGLTKSLPFLPTAIPAELTADGKIPHPGYVE